MGATLLIRKTMEHTEIHGKHRINAHDLFRLFYVFPFIELFFSGEGAAFEKLAVALLSFELTVLDDDMTS